MEMNEQLQQKLWEEAKCFVENSSKKHLAHFGVTLDGVDDQYLELSFTCPCNDEDFDDFLAIIDNEFLQTIRFECPNVRIQEFTCDIPIEVRFDMDDWQHIVQLSVGDDNTALFNKFTYWKIEHEKMTAGFRKSSLAFDKIYLQSLKQMAKHLDVVYDFGGSDIYDKMISIESAIHEYFEKKNV